MKARTAARVAWLTWIVALAFPLAMIAVSIRRDWDSPTSDIGISIGFLVLQLAFSTVGALVASRRDRNPIGWLLCKGLLSAWREPVKAMRLKPWRHPAPCPQATLLLGSRTGPLGRS